MYFFVGRGVGWEWECLMFMIYFFFFLLFFFFFLGGGGGGGKHHTLCQANCT